MSNNKRIFSNITEQVFDCLKKALSDKKVEFPPATSGFFTAKAKGFSFEFQFAWDGKNLLEITCTKKSFAVPYKKIWKIIESGILDCGGELSG